MRFLDTQPIRRQVVVAAILLLLPITVAVIWAARITVSERLSVNIPRSEALARAGDRA